MIANYQDPAKWYLPYAIENIKLPSQQWVAAPYFVDELMPFISSTSPPEDRILEYFRQVCYAIKKYNAPYTLYVNTKHINVFLYGHTALKQIAPDYPVKHLLVFNSLGINDGFFLSNSSSVGGPKKIKNTNEQYTYNLGQLLYEMLTQSYYTDKISVQSLQGKFNNFTLNISQNILSDKGQRSDVDNLCFYMNIKGLYTNYKGIKSLMNFYQHSPNPPIRSIVKSDKENSKKN
jgi:hypothetical protein